MFKSKDVVQARFYRNETISSIKVWLENNKEPISFYYLNIEHCSKVLSGKEIKTVIEILECKKELMLKECNFPPVYEEMLSDLIEAYNERYCKPTKKDNKRKLGYSLSVWQLEELLKERYNFKEVHISSIDVGSSRYNAERIDLDSDYRYLVLSFREGEEEDG